MIYFVMFALRFWLLVLINCLLVLVGLVTLVVCLLLSVALVDGFCIG